ncbi:MAG TPA: class II glutamine amidotransferase, partial [Candidatus Competibacteraceae bacterium]|nr:class II glutamine amidotransferase [Candidatus Competibacteraceae bacterium]
PPRPRGSPARPLPAFSVFLFSPPRRFKSDAYHFSAQRRPHLYAHCGTQLSWLTRRAPFGQARLMDADMLVDFQAETTPDDIVTVIATQPLTDNEAWTVMPPGALTVFNAGERVAEFAA